MSFFEVLNELPELEEIIPEKKRSPFDYINSINDKQNLRDDLSGFNSFITIKAFSQFIDTLFLASELNKYNLESEMVYDFFYHSVSKKKRFGKWGKSDYDETKLQQIIEFYNINRRKAIDLLEIVDFDYIKEQQFKGGVKNN